MSSVVMMTALAFIAVFNRPQPGAEVRAATQLLNSPATMLVSLSGEGEGKGSQGSLFVAPGMDQALLRIHGLKACSHGSSY